MANALFFAITAVVLLLAIVRLCSADGSEACTYPDCVFAGVNPRQTDVDSLFHQLKFNELSNNIRMSCVMVKLRAKKCEAQFVGCLRKITRTYPDRFEDPVYVRYRVNLGLDICDNYNRYIKLKQCFTVSLQKHLQQYISDNGYDIPCLRKAFLELNKCTKEEQDIFLKLFDSWLVKNPYQTRKSGQC